MSWSEDPSQVESGQLLRSALHSATVAAEQARFAIVALHELNRRANQARFDETAKATAPNPLIQRQG